MASRATMESSTPALVGSLTTLSLEDTVHFNVNVIPTNLEEQPAQIQASLAAFCNTHSRPRVNIVTQKIQDMDQ
ncbi:hypothetical protein DXG03_008240 [Asterophora parasitica]|uniref:Uncharacterized protein n=1 Tax=Asterophora parasitica TaxID=117018 RepID=A0A9P7G6L1_9AGAR|nr:hypothetical protein DXG03_008240 [Asterophora parasitica]